MRRFRSGCDCLEGSSSPAILRNCPGLKGLRHPEAVCVDDKEIHGSRRIYFSPIGLTGFAFDIFSMFLTLVTRSGWVVHSSNLLLHGDYNHVFRPDSQMGPSYTVIRTSAILT